MSNRQYVACEFTPGGRPYTYHYEGSETLSAGDRVVVENRDSEKTVTVASVLSEAPRYDTKAILRIAEAKEEKADAAE